MAHYPTSCKCRIVAFGVNWRVRSYNSYRINWKWISRKWISQKWVNQKWRLLSQEIYTFPLVSQISSVSVEEWSLWRPCTCPHSRKQCLWTPDPGHSIGACLGFLETRVTLSLSPQWVGTGINIRDKDHLPDSKPRSVWLWLFLHGNWTKKTSLDAN